MRINFQLRIAAAGAQHSLEKPLQPHAVPGCNNGQVAQNGIPLLKCLRRLGCFACGCREVYRGCLALGWCSALAGWCRDWPAVFLDLDSLIMQASPQTCALENATNGPSFPELDRGYGPQQGLGFYMTKLGFLLQRKRESKIKKLETLPGRRAKTSEEDFC